jgi:hypothetical protein
MVGIATNYSMKNLWREEIIIITKVGRSARSKPGG